MKRCPITYEEIIEGKYSPKGLRQLSAKLKDLEILPYSSDEFYKEYINRAGKMSIQGIQPKLSMILNAAKQRFEIVDIMGKFIAKPQNRNYHELPENEDLTMRMAKVCGIEIPWHGLIFSKNDELCYMIKRFDRKGHRSKLAVEDFSQLAQKKRKTKYDSSMEKVVSVIDQFATFPVIEKLKLFRIVLFNFLTGNEDMHLKNFSLITREQKVEMSPSYDLLNTSIAIEAPIEEIALSIAGKKSNLKKKDFVEYFARQRMRLPGKNIHTILEEIESCIPQWENLISISFLSDNMKDKYNILLDKRLKVLYS